MSYSQFVTVALDEASRYESEGLFTDALYIYRSIINNPVLEEKTVGSLLLNISVHLFSLKRYDDVIFLYNEAYKRFGWTLFQISHYYLIVDIYKKIGNEKKYSFYLKKIEQIKVNNSVPDKKACKPICEKEVTLNKNKQIVIDSEMNDKIARSDKIKKKPKKRSKFIGAFGAKSNRIKNDYLINSRRYMTDRFKD